MQAALDVRVHIGVAPKELAAIAATALGTWQLANIGTRDWELSAGHVVAALQSIIDTFDSRVSALVEPLFHKRCCVQPVLCCTGWLTACMSIERLDAYTACEANCLDVHVRCGFHAHSTADKLLIEKNDCVLSHPPCMGLVL